MEEGSGNELILIKTRVHKGKENWEEAWER